MTSNIFLNSNTADYDVENLNDTSSDDWMSQLLRSRILQQVPTANLQKILMKMEKVDVKQGQKVIIEGDEGFDFYLLHQGIAEFSQQRSATKKPFTRKLVAGDTFGEEALLSKKPRSGTIQMLTDGILFRLDKDSFVKYIKTPFETSMVYEEAKRKVELGWLTWTAKCCSPARVSIEYPGATTAATTTATASTTTRHAVRLPL